MADIPIKTLTEIVDLALEETKDAESVRVNANDNQEEEEVEEVEDDNGEEITSETILVFTASDLLTEVWIEAFDVLRNLRLLIASISQGLKELRIEDVIYVEGANVRDVLMRLYGLWIKLDDAEEYCAREDASDLLRINLKNRLFVPFFAAGLMSAETYRHWVTTHREYINSLPITLPRESLQSPEIPSRVTSTGATITTTTMTTKLTDESSGSAAKSRPVTATTTTTKYKMLPMRASVTTLDEIQRRADEMQARNNIEGKGSTSESNVTDSIKKRKRARRSDEMVVEEEEEEEEDAVAEGQERPVVVSWCESLGSLLKDASNVSDRSSQHVAFREKANGTVTTLKTPGETGSQLVRMQIYDMAEISNREQRTWWRYAKMRAQFFTSGVSTDRKEIHLEHLLSEVVINLKKIPGTTQETRAYAMD